MICVCMGFRKRRVGVVDRERDITVFYVYVHLGGVGEGGVCLSNVLYC